MRLNKEQRRVLELLAGTGRGATEPIMLANGFNTDVLAGLVLAGLSTVVTETVKAGGRPNDENRALLHHRRRQASVARRVTHDRTESASP